MSSGAPLSSYNSSINVSSEKPQTMELIRYALPANVGAIIVLYLVLFTVSFIVLMTFNPGFVQSSTTVAGTPQTDFGKCFVISLIVALILCIIIYLFLLAC